ncbi:CA protein [Parelaphostrongylus tenuis]|uniref:CA protein n=1 Tax=Parelaphostrongylus tenuis TaxID=148309 RepID=A0AAD5RAA7_PARTN|nr:CA protein [Parelaphostrongylus tenuis]
MKCVKLIVSAWNVFDSTKNASRILRIVVEDIDDTVPVFGKGLNSVFIVPPSPDRDDIVIGTVSAVGSKRNLLNPLHYYLLPKCSPEYEKFSVDNHGTITLRGRPANLPRRIQLCIFTSNNADLKTINMTFDPKNESMVRAIVIFEDATSFPRFPILQNNTVTVIPEGLRSASIPVTDSKGFDRGVRYVIDHVKFTAVQNSTKLPTDISSLFFIEPITGEVGANPRLSDNPQGVYTVVINVLSTTTMLKQPLQLFRNFHYVSDDMKTRYVFGMMSEEFAVNREQYTRKLQTAFEADHPNGTMQVFFSEPKRDRRNCTWTSVCFHMAIDKEILNEHSTMSALSPPADKNSELSRLYSHFKVINIESCTDPRSSSFQQAIYQVSTQVIVPIVSVIILIIMLIALLIYVCFVRRYKEHLRLKKKQMKEAERKPSPINYTPTFILPPMTQHIRFY